MTLEELLNKPFQKEISTGKHIAKLLKAPVYVPNEKDPNNAYMIMEWDLDNGDCQYKRNMFLRDVSIMLSHVRRQLGKQDETIQPLVFFNELVTNSTTFDMWFEYVTVPTRKGLERRQNIRFIEKIEAPASAGSADSETANDSAELEQMAG